MTRVLKIGKKRVYISMLCYVMLFSSLPWGFSVADYIQVYYAYF